MFTGVLALLVTTGIFTFFAVMLLVAERYLANYGSCLVRINEGSVEFEQPGGGTLLAALYDHKVFIPSACGGKGSCGYCKVVVLSGGGPLLPTETPYVTRAEVRTGVRLACQVKIKQPLELKLPEELLNVREFKARVSLVRELTRDIKEINLQLMEPAEIRQRPGQYVQILAPGPDGPVFRAYSISSPAYETRTVQLVVRLVPGGIASSYIHGLKEGEPVTFTGPFGEFRLSEDPQKAVICVGGGAGMAPISNIIHTLYRRWPDRPCYLFFGCRTTSDVFYLDVFQKLAREHANFQVVYALSDPLAADEQWGGDTGFIHLSVDKRLPGGSGAQAFLCGPPPMIEAVKEVLQQKGLKDSEVFYDKF